MWIISPDRSAMINSKEISIIKKEQGSPFNNKPVITFIHNSGISQIMSFDDEQSRESFVDSIITGLEQEAQK